MPSKADFPADFWEKLPCPICENPVGSPDYHGFCQEHYQRYQERQSTGVSLAELDHRWHDTLATWRDRPEPLNREPKSDRLQYWSLLGRPWVLFMRGYPNRLPDWLVYNQETSEVRRFVDISSNEVLEEMMGGNRAPGQEDLQERWGKEEEGDDLRSQMRDRFEELQAEPYRPPDVAEIIRQAQFPVYGLVRDTLDLTLGPLCYGGSPLESVELGFVSPASIHEDPDIAVWIESKVRRYRVILQEQSVKEWEARSAAEQLWGNSAPQAVREEWFKDRKRLRNTLADLGAESRKMLRCRIPDFQTEVTALAWTDVRPLFAFLLENEASVLVVATLGLTNQQVEELSGAIGQVNDRADLLSEYQTAFNARHQEVEKQAAELGPVELIFDNEEFEDGSFIDTVEGDPR
jgi:hypothetical protein